MSDFHLFRDAVHEQFKRMLNSPMLYIVDIERDALYQEYLGSFPPGSNPVFRERTEHDCSTCRNFIKNIGNVVAFIGNDLVSVWDVEVPEPYKTVAQEMRDLVLTAPIASVYHPEQVKYGNEITYDKGETWQHFEARFPPDRVQLTGALRSHQNTSWQMAVDFDNHVPMPAPIFDTLIGLLPSIYRGEEFRSAVEAAADFFCNAPLNINAAYNYYWKNVLNPACRFANTVIGELFMNLAEGQDIEVAVAKYEAMVAPDNYKRTTALITPGMIKNSVDKLRELGCEESLQRRHAKLSDMSVNDVLWVNNESATHMKDALVDSLMAEAKVKPGPASSTHASISIDEFMEKVLPTAKAMQILFTNDMEKNLASITAPVKPDAAKLFHWNNGFAWSYKQGTADAFQERVKRQGGATEGAMRASLIWDNRDDLDLHAVTPAGHIYYSSRSAGTGVLDIDANGMNGMMKDPVENIVWEKLRDGTYELRVHQYALRERTNVGFNFQLVVGGNTYEMAYPKMVTQGKTISCATVKVKKGEVEVAFGNEVTVTPVEKFVWGMKTGQFHDVSLVTLSPNYWGDDKGNKHWFFIMKDCKNPDKVRGFYNEFLRSEFNQHRKVFEVLADKTRCEPADEQLSGFGFSSTIRTSFVACVTGTDGSSVTYKVNV